MYLELDASSLLIYADELLPKEWPMASRMMTIVEAASAVYDVV